MSSTTTKTTKKKKKPLTILFKTCVNADDPSLARPVEIVTKVERFVWDKEMEGWDGDVNNDFLFKIHNESMQRLPGVLGGPLRCRGCHGECRICVCSEHLSVEKHLVKDPHALTMEKFIIIPVCGLLTDCATRYKDVCEDYASRHMNVDACNPSVVRDYTGFGGAPGQKPDLVYSLHIDADLGEARDHIATIPNFDLPFAANTWLSVPETKRHEVLRVIEASAIQSILAQNVSQFTPFSCRICLQPAHDFAYRHPRLQLGAPVAVLDPGAAAAPVLAPR